MAKLSTHVLDQASGKPAAGVHIDVFRDGMQLQTVVTNTDGRTDKPLLEGDAFTEGAYMLVFHIGDYFDAEEHDDAKRFLDAVPIAFTVDDATQNYHVPLLASPWSYTTYRGS
ncbi:MAG: hydroxyisourate hydrolase [Tepidisphaeraceae bacterium]